MASRRLQESIEAAAAKDDFQTVSENLKLWTALLSKSLKDIEPNLKAKKKSRALISYEIQVRKSIADTGNIKIKAPVDQQDLFDSCISQAEAVRGKFRGYPLSALGVGMRRRTRRSIPKRHNNMKAQWTQLRMSNIEQGISNYEVTVAFAKRIVAPSSFNIPCSTFDILLLIL